MASGAIAGVGTVFTRGSEALAEVNSIAGPTMSRNTIDVTSLDSTDGYKEFIAGMRDAGEVTLNMNFSLATYALILADFESDTLQTYTITFADDAGTILAFSGLVTACPFGSITPDDKVAVDVTIKISGPVEMTTV